MSRVSSPSTLISVADLRQRLGEPHLRIVDCRFDLMEPSKGRELWRSGHVPGAVYADLDQDLSGPVTADSGRHPLPDVETAAETLGRLGIDNSSSVVVYDADSGGLAARAWWLLRWLGHERVVLLDGGLQAWHRAGLSVEQGEVAVEFRTFKAVPKVDWLMTTKDIAELIHSGADPRLVDARDSARFRGEVEPIDTVAGHIPGAKNLPFGANLSSEGLWKSPAELRALLEDVLGTQPGAPWSVMCGSGVTACHLVLAARLAGIHEPRLYVGSWSEWIRDPSRPVVRGS